MIMYTIILIFAFSFIVLVLILKINIELSYVRYNDVHEEIECIIDTFFGLLRWQYKIPVIKLYPKLHGVLFELNKHKEAPAINSSVSGNHLITLKQLESFTQRTRKLLLHMKQFKKWILSTCDHIEVNQLRWETSFSLEDAATTGIATGYLWMLKSIVIQWLTRLFTFREHPCYIVHPTFDERNFVTYFQMKVACRIFHLLQSLIMLIVNITMTHRGWKTWLKMLHRT